MRILICLFAWVIIFAGTVYAGTVSGKVLSQDAEPLAFANVTITKYNTTELITGDMTDIDGKFDINIGNYDDKITVTISYVGYETASILAEKASDLGEIVLQRSDNTLKEVEVKGKRQNTKITGRGLLTRVANTQLSQLGTAQEVLQYIPLMEKDGDSWKVTGHGSPMFYINGRLVRDLTELKRLQSTDIINIEVITNPGAKYPAATGSVVKIKTRRPQGEGLSGIALSSYTQQHRPNLTEYLSLNYRYRQLDFFSTVAYSRSTSRNENYGVHNLNTPVAHRYDNSELLYGISENLNVTGGFTYTRSIDSSLGVRYNLSLTPYGKSWGHHNTDVYDQDILRDQIHTEMADYQKKSPVNMINAYYINKIGRTSVDLNIDYMGTNGGSRRYTSEASKNEGNRSLTSFSDMSSDLVAAKLVLGNSLLNGTIEWGAEYTHTSWRGSYRNPEEIIGASHSKLREDNIAPFVEYSITLPIGYLSAGVRYEHVASDYFENGIRVDNLSRNYDNLFPSFSWAAQIKAMQLQLSYNAVTQRPSYSQLDNNVSYGDRFQYQSGNPYLKSSLTHDMSLLAIWNFILGEISYNDDRNAVIMWSEQYAPNPDVTLLTLKNVNSIKRLTATVTASPEFGCYNPRLTLTLVKPWFKMPINDVMTKFNRPSYVIRLNNIFTLPDDWMLTATCNLSIDGDYENNHSNKRSNFIMSATAYKWFMNRSLQLSASVSDIFDSSDNHITLYTGISTISQYSISDTRSVNITARYFFNLPYNQNRKYKGSGAGENEKKRIGINQ